MSRFRVERKLAKTQGSVLLNIIDEFVKVTKDKTDAPIEFIYATAYHLVSNMLGRYFFCPTLPPFNKRPNLWFLLSSIAGAFRRSTILGQEKLVYSEVLQSIKEPYENILESQIAEGSVEGVADQIYSASSKGINTFAIKNPEFGGTLKRMQKEKYMSGVQNFYCALYSGEGYAFSLSRRQAYFKRIIPDGLYVTMLASMQDPDQYLARPQIRQGLLRRIQIIYATESDRWLPFSTERYDEKKDYGLIINEISSRMPLFKEIITTSPIVDHFKTARFIPMIPVSDVDDKWNEVARQIDNDARSNPSDYNIYKQAYIEANAKLSLVYAIADIDTAYVNEARKSDPEFNVPIQMKHYLQSKKFLDTYSGKMKKVIDELPEFETKIRTYKNATEQAYSAIFEAGVDGITTTRFSKRFQYWGSTKTQILSSLLESGRVFQRIKPSTGGRKAIVYVADVYKGDFDAKFN